MALSKQTPDTPFFAYNPFAGATLLMFPADRDPKNPRRFIVETDFRDCNSATACNGRIRLSINAAKQVECFVNDKRTERFTIIYAGKRKKKVFASY